MKNILGNSLGDVMSVDNREIRADKMQEYVLSEMGLSNEPIKSTG